MTGVTHHLDQYTVLTFSRRWPNVGVLPTCGASHGRFRIWEVIP
jgi:hypothetical protein